MTQTRRPQPTVGTGDNLDSGDVTFMAKGAGIVFAGSILSFGLRYFFQVLVARQIGPDLFGLFSLGISIFVVAEVISALGTTKGVVRFVSLYHRDGDERRVRGTVALTAIVVLVGGTVVCGLLAVLSGLLSTAVFHTSALAPVLRRLAIGIPFSALTTVFICSLLGLKIVKYKVYVRDGFEPMLKAAVAVLLFLLGWKLGAAVSAFVVSIIAGTFLSYFFYRRVFHEKLGSNAPPIMETKRLLTFCWPLLFASCLAILEIWLTTFMVGFFLTPGAVGVFSAAYRTSLLVQGVLFSFNAIISPIIPSLHHGKELRKLESLFKMVSKWIFSLSLPAIVFLITLPREIMNVFGQDFLTGAPTLLVLGIGQLAISATGPLGMMIDMSGKSKITLLNTILQLVLQALLCVLLIPKYGIIGAACSKAMSDLFLRMLQLVEVHLTLRMHPFRRDFLKPLIAATTGVAVLGLMRFVIPDRNIPLSLAAVGVLTFLAIYGFVLHRLGLNEEDREILQKIKEKLPV